MGSTAPAGRQASKHTHTDTGGPNEGQPSVQRRSSRQSSLWEGLGWDGLHPAQAFLRHESVSQDRGKGRRVVE